MENFIFCAVTLVLLSWIFFLRVPRSILDLLTVIADKIGMTFKP